MPLASSFWWRKAAGRLVLSEDRNENGRLDMGLLSQGAKRVLATLPGVAQTALR
jgi:hypothetical protein